MDAHMGAHAETPIKAYLCECGKKWTLNSKAFKSNRFVCNCGRTILMRHGMVFSIGKQGTRG